MAQVINETTVVELTENDAIEMLEDGKVVDMDGMKLVASNHRDKIDSGLVLGRHDFEALLTGAAVPYDGGRYIVFIAL